MSIYGPHGGYQGVLNVPEVSLTSSRRVEGTVYLTWLVGTAVGKLIDYNHYILVRKIREYPRSETDGYVLDTGVLTTAELSGTYLDDIPDEEGQVVYYVLFCRRSLDSVYLPAGVAYCNKTQLHFDEISSTYYPQVLQKEQPMADFSNPMTWMHLLLNPAMGEVESLIKSMVRNFDIDEADPLALDGLGSLCGWNVSPQMHLIDFRELLKVLPGYFRKKSQISIALTILEQISGTTIGIQQFKRCQEIVADLAGEYISTNLELVTEGVGDGITQTFVHTPSQEIIRATVRVYSGSQTIVDDGDGNLYLESSPGTPCGSVVYSGAGKTISAQFPVPPTLNNTVWVYYEYQAGSWDIADPEVTTRLLYIGDRVKRNLSSNAGVSPVAQRVYIYLAMDTGEEGVLSTEANCYPKVYVDDIKRKLRIFWPLFGKTNFYWTDRTVITASPEAMSGNLPLEHQMGTCK